MLVPVVPENLKRIIRSFQRSVPVDVTELAKALGIHVWEADLATASGKLFRDTAHGGSAQYSIIVSASDPFVRKRFTVAHEIAHFLLHRDGAPEIVDDAFYRSGLGSRQEADANRLAAEILMPNVHMTPESKTTADMASEFAVSEMAMTIRLSYLGKEKFL